MTIVSEFHRDRRQCVHFDGKVSASVDVVSGVPQCRALGSLLIILYTFELFSIVGNHIVGYADDTTIYPVISRPLSCPQVLESLNQDLTAINSWCLKWNIRLNAKKTKSMETSLSWTIAPGYLTLGGAELEEVKSLRILGITFDSQLTFETHLRGSCVEGSPESGGRASNRKGI